MNDKEFALIVVTILLVICDYITGVIKACMIGDLSSSKMKYGLLKKFVYLILMFVCWLIDFTSKKVDLGFTIPLFTSVSVGIILIEITSIFENCCSINPDIKNANIFSIIKNSNKNNEVNKNDESH